MNENSGQINLVGDFINLETKKVVELQENFTIYTDDGPKVVEVKVSTDFNKIPEKYHEIFFNVLSAKYLNKVSFGHNPFSECKPIRKRKWYQFWKSKYFQ